MEEKRREAGMQLAATSSAAAGAESAASEPGSSRRRAGAQKRKASALLASNVSSTPSKRMTREKNLIAHSAIYNHNGPLTRARQGPTTLAAAVTTATVGGALGSIGGMLEVARDDTKLRAAEELNIASDEWEVLGAKIEADFEAIRSRDSNVHVVPTHCGWFSWTKIHPLEEQALSSFFSGKSPDRTPDIYMEIRNWIMKKFHSNPNTQIELKDLSDFEVGSLDAGQEVMEFLDYWGLINFHPFPPVESIVANADCNRMTDADTDGVAKKDSLLEELYHFEEIKACPPVALKPNITFPAMPSGLFPESAIAEELAKLEGPAVEYHCNSCSADCSRKRYHCQKQADFDLCTDCFSNGKFGCGMSSSDFILMVPAEAAGVSGGKWTDQETLLLLEALELYKENWNEIAEHVATKTKAQCILHFIQMPIEDTFLDCDDDVDTDSKETADPAAINIGTSASKYVPGTSESKTGAVEGQSQTSPMETLKPEDAREMKICEDGSKPKDENKVKVDGQKLKSEDTSEGKVGRETDENIALKALKEAFEVVGYLPTPESPYSFADVGNPVMALAAFFALLVGPDMAAASAHSSLKSISGNSPAMQLAAKHCFILEDPPGDKEPARSESIVAEMADRDTRKDENPEDRNIKESNSTSVLDERDLSNDHGDKIIEDSVPEEKRQSASSNEISAEKLHDAKGPNSQGSPEKVETGDLNELNNSKSPKDNQPSIVQESNDLPSKVPQSSQKESREGSSGELTPPIDVAKDVNLLSDSIPSGKNEPDQPVTSNSVAEPCQPSNAFKDVDMVSDSLPVENNDPVKQITPSSKVEPSQPSEASRDVEMVSGLLPSEISAPDRKDSITGTETVAGEDQIRDGKDEKHDSKETNDDHYVGRVKRAAVSALSAAAVKAKLLACQEEDQVRQLATSLIEKQLQKLEAKLAFFDEMDNVTLKVREQLERSRQRLYQERALIIHSRLGPSRAMQPSMPANRIPMTFANSVARPPMSMTSPRPPISRSMGPQASTLSNPFGSTTAGSSIRPSSQDNLSSVGTK